MRGEKCEGFVTIRRYYNPTIIFNGTDRLCKYFYGNVDTHSFNYFDRDTLSNKSLSSPPLELFEEKYLSALFKILHFFFFFFPSFKRNFNPSPLSSFPHNFILHSVYIYIDSQESRT